MFSFKISFPAIVLALIVVVAVEAAFSFILPRRYVYHEVDQVLYALDHEVFNAQTVVVGDSTAHQLLADGRAPDYNGKITFLPTNRSIEITGQYYLLKRYLRKNKKPKSIIFLGLVFLNQSLDRSYTENYIQRCFLRVDEIMELASFKGIKFGSVMLLYKLFPSYRFRLLLQKRILGKTNADVYTGLSLIQKNTRENALYYDANNDSFWNQPARGISFVYFERLIALLSKNNINFYFILAPIPESISKDIKFRKNYEAMDEYFRKLRTRYSNFNYFINTVVYPDSEFLDDHVHFTLTGEERATAYWQSIMREIGG